jgi:predicted MFS family arabinose efflux permease
MSSALLNVSVNTCAAWVERQEQMIIMSTCHGSWSLGGAIGSTVASVAYALEVPPMIHSIFIVSITILMGWWIIRKPLLAITGSVELQASEAKEKTGWMLPSGAMLMLIITGSMLFIGEGTAFDWSAIYMRDVLKASPGIVPLGYFAFALCMAAMRFSGDWLIPKVGKKRVLMGSLLSAATGITLCAWATQPALGILGFAILGMGTALGAPILFSAAMQMPGVAPAAGMATFSTFSFLGFLGGPPAIGFLAKQVGLSGSFLFVGVMLVLGALLASRLRL